MIDFGVMPFDQAKAYCDAYAGGVPQRVAWLRGVLSASGGSVDTIDAGAEGLVALWTWAVEQLDRSDDGIAPPNRPPWYSPEKANPYLSDRSLWLIDALGCHLAELVGAVVPGAYWDVYRVGRRFSDVDQHRCMLHGLPGRPADPAQMVYGSVIGMVLHGKGFDPDELVKLYAYLIGDR